jgi:hypothetical protein
MSDIPFVLSIIIIVLLVLYTPLALMIIGGLLMYNGYMVIGFVIFTIAIYTLSR